VTYHHITLNVCMRNCDNAQDALRQLIRLMVRHPDESTYHMESWSVDAIHSEDEEYDRSTHVKELQLEALQSLAEVDA
jgi:hypothetical protein